MKMTIKVRATRTMVAAVFAVAMPWAAEAADPTAPCAQSSEYTTVGLSGAHEDVTPAVMPGYPRYPFVDHDAYPEDSIVRFKYRIDVSGSATAPSATAAAVTISLRYDPGVSEYDLYLYDANGDPLGASTNGPVGLDLSGTDAVVLDQVAHCTDLRVDIINAYGLPPDSMTLDTTLGDLG